MHVKEELKLHESELDYLAEQFHRIQNMTFTQFVASVKQGRLIIRNNINTIKEPWCSTHLNTLSIDVERRKRQHAPQKKQNTLRLFRR